MANEQTSSPETAPSATERAEVQPVQPTQAPEVINTANHANLGNRVLGSARERLAAQVELEKVQKIEALNNIQRQPPKNKKEEEVWYSPSTWTPEHKKEAQNVALIGAGVVGAALLFSWLTRKTASAAHSVAETGRSAGRGLQFLFWSAVATAGAYLGIKAWQNIGELKKMKAKVEKFGSDVRDGVREKFGSGRNGENNEDEISEDKPVPPEEIEDGKKKIARESAVRAILFSTYDVPWEGATNDLKIVKMNDILESASNKNVTMGDIILCQNNANGSSELTGLLGLAGDEKHQIPASTVFLKFCGEEMGHVRNVLKQDGVPEDKIDDHLCGLSVDQFLRLALRGHFAIFGAIESIASGSISEFHDRLKSCDFKKLVSNDDYFQQELVESVGEIDIEEIDLEKLIAEHLTEVDVTVSVAAGKTATTPEEKLLQHIYSKILSDDDTYKYLVPLFHGCFPTNDKTDTAEQVKLYMQNRMPAAQAVRLYLYKRMVRKSNPAALGLMQLEVLQFVAKHDIERTEKYRMMTRMLKRGISGGSSELLEEWKALNITIDPQIFENAKQYIAATAPFIKRSVLSAIGNTLAESWAATSVFFQENPTEIVTLAAAGTGIMEVTRQIKLATVNFKRIADRLEKLGGNVQNRGPLGIKNLPHRLRQITPFMADHADILKTGANFKEIQEVCAKLPLEANELLTRCVRQPMNAARWNELAARLSSLGHPNTGTLATEIAANAKYQRIINIQRFTPNLSGWLPGVSNMPLRLYERARALAVAGGSKWWTATGKLKPIGKFTGRVLGPAGVAVSAYQIYDYHFQSGAEMQKAIDAEKDPGRRQHMQLELRNQAIGAYADTAGSTMLCVPFPPVQIVGGAIILGNIAGQYAASGVFELNDYMLQNADNLTGQHTGHILHQVERTDGKSLNWSQSILSVVQDFDKANMNVRHEAYRAYFQSVGLHTLPPVGYECLTQEDMLLDEAGRQNRLNIMKIDQEGEYVRATVEYLSHHTNGQYNSVDAHMLRRADAYGRIAVLNWQRRTIGLEQQHISQKSWEEREELINQAGKQDEDSLVAGLNELKKNPEQANKLIPVILFSSLEHDIAEFDKKIRIADFSGWEWTGGEEETRIAVRLAAMTQLKDKVKTISDGWAGQTTISLEQYQAAIHECRGLCNRNPVDLEADAEPFFEKASRYQDASVVSTQQGLQELLSPNEVKERRRSKGLEIMRNIWANDNGNYFTKQYGWIGSKFLYMQFDEASAKWVVGLGSTSDMHHDPESFAPDTWGGDNKYKKLCEDLAEVNRMS